MFLRKLLSRVERWWGVFALVARPDALRPPSRDPSRSPSTVTVSCAPPRTGDPIRGTCPGAVPPSPVTRSARRMPPHRRSHSAACRLLSAVGSHLDRARPTVRRALSVSRRRLSPPQRAFTCAAHSAPLAVGRPPSHRSTVTRASDTSYLPRMPYAASCWSRVSEPRREAEGRDPCPPRDRTFSHPPDLHAATPRDGTFSLAGQRHTTRRAGRSRSRFSTLAGCPQGADVISGTSR